jgi:hypothetical protein
LQRLWRAGVTMRLLDERIIVWPITIAVIAQIFTLALFG